MARFQQEDAGRPDSTTTGTVRQFVGFRLEETEYAIPIMDIREIILMRPITRIPHAPEAVEGLINLRGSVIPVVNLRRRFRLPAREFDEETRIIVTSLHDQMVGCVADHVTQVLRIGTDQIQPAPTSVASGGRRFVSGLAKLDDRLIVILDLSRLIDPTELEATSAAVPSPSDHSF